MRVSIPSWHEILSQGFSSAAELLAFLELPAHDSHLAEKQFKTRVPRGFAARMQKGNWRDPLLLQVLARDDELKMTPGFVTDPLLESSANPVPGLIHKYQGRVLLTVTGSCAVNCRYCFRRHFSYHTNNPGREGWQAAMAYIASDSSIQEVILSGGDPLMAPNTRLQYLLAQLADIPHVKTIRFHTRIPVVLPERIDEDFLNLLKNTSLQMVMVLHVNHPNEITDDIRAICTSLKKTGCHIFNQSVLLKDVNDHVDTLVALSERLFACGVLPYYLHLLDNVQGAQAFEVKLTDALNLFARMQSRLPGYLVPRLVKEQVGEGHKTLVVAWDEKNFRNVEPERHGQQGQ